VRAEADQSERTERQQTEHRRPCHLPAFAPARGSEHEERQHQAGRDLDANADDERSGGGSKARVGPRGQSQRGSEHHHDQRVVVRPADREHEQHWVQSDECSGPATRLPELAGGARDEGDGAEARGDGERLERPQAAGEPERRGGIAGEREQRPVGGMLIRPAEEPDDFVAGGLRGHVRVRVQSVQRAEAGEAEVAEHVLGDQWRAQQQNRVCGEDRGDQRAHRQRACERQHQQIARAHDQRQRLKATGADAHAQAVQGAGQPAGPAAAAARHVLRRFTGGPGDRQEGRNDDPQQPEQGQRAGDRSGAARGRAAGAARAMAGAAGDIDRHARQGRGGRHRLIVTSRSQAGV
jgi:hypothetical protein